LALKCAAVVRGRQAVERLVHAWLCQTDYPLHSDQMVVPCLASIRSHDSAIASQGQANPDILSAAEANGRFWYVQPE
jgi:hypothetical protein